MTIGNYEGTEDEYWDYESRAVGLMAAREIIKEENERINSPLFSIVDTSNFIFQVTLLVEEVHMLQRLWILPLML